MARTTATEVGADLTPISHQMTMEDMILFSEEGDRNIHTDDGVARAAGLPGAVVAGVQMMAFIYEMLHLEYGFDSVPGTVVDVRFRALVLAGDTVTARGRVTEAEPQRDGQCLSLEVWCENHRGEQVITGTAQVPFA